VVKVKEVRVEDGTCVYVWECPVCGKELRSLSKPQLYNNALSHSRKHKAEKQAIK
jgi:hypothetical protein